MIDNLPQMEAPREKVMTAYEYLKLDKNPMLTKTEKFIAQQFSRNLKIQEYPSYVTGMKPGETFYEGQSNRFENKATDQQVETIRFDEKNRNREFSEIVNILAHNNNNDASALIDIGKAAIAGNFLERVIAKRGNCLEFALATKLIAEKYGFSKHKDIPVEIIPFNVESISNGNATPLAHDHFAIYYKEKGIGHMAFYGGFTIPVDLVANYKSQPTELDKYIENEFIAEGQTGAKFEKSKKLAKIYSLTAYRSLRKIIPQPI